MPADVEQVRRGPNLLDEVTDDPYDVDSDYGRGYGVGFEAGLQEYEATINRLAAERERGRAEGRQWAIDTLRDGEAFMAWLASDEPQCFYANVSARGSEISAEYLEAMAPGADT